MPLPKGSITAKNLHGPLLRILCEEEMETKPCVERLRAGIEIEYDEMYRLANTAFFDLKSAGLTETPRKGLWRVTKQGIAILQAADQIGSVLWTPQMILTPYGQDPECFGYYLPTESMCKGCPAQTACFHKTKERLSGL